MDFHVSYPFVVIITIVTASSVLLNVKDVMPKSDLEIKFITR